MIEAQNEARAVYNGIKEFYSKMGTVIPTRGQLRLEQVGTAKNRYKFPVLADEGSPRPSERRLARTDAFWVDRVAIYLAVRNLNRVAPAVGDQPYSSVTLLAYPSPLVFPIGPQLDAAEAILNGGTLSIEIDQVKWVKQFDALRNRYTMGGASEALVVGAETLEAGAAWRDDLVMGKMVPTVRLNGGSSNDIEVTVNEAINFTGTPVVGATPGTENIVMVMLDGWYVANAGEFQPARTM